VKNHVVYKRGSNVPRSLSVRNVAATFTHVTNTRPVMHDWKQIINTRLRVILVKMYGNIHSYHEKNKTVTKHDYHSNES